MSTWQLEVSDPITNKKSTQDLVAGAYVLGRSSEADILCSSKTASRRHARLEVRPGYVLITDLGSANGTYIKGERIYQTTKLQSGDRFKIGAQDYVLQLPHGQKTNEINFSLYFTSRNRRKELSTLPYYIGYNSRTKQVFGTSDPYHKENVLKIDLGPSGIFCRNITGIPDFQLNNSPFQTESLHHGTKLSTPGEDIVFESGFGSLTGISEFNSSADELISSKSYKNKKLLGILAVLVVLVSVSLYYLYNQSRWSTALTQSIMLYQSEARAYNSAFLVAGDMLAGENSIVKLVEPYRLPYSSLRKEWTRVSSSAFIGKGISMLMPQTKDNIDAAFKSVDHVFELEQELSRAAPVHKELADKISLIADTTSTDKLKEMRESASILQPVYSMQKIILHELVKLTHQLQALNQEISQMSGFKVLIEIGEQLTRHENILRQQSEACIKLDHLCTNLIAIIPE